MKLFRRRADTTQPANQPVVAAITVPATIPAESASAAIKQSFETIALSAKQKEILEKPLDPRVDRILQELHADKAAAEEALKARQVC